MGAGRRPVASTTAVRTLAGLVGGCLVVGGCSTPAPPDPDALAGYRPAPSASANLDATKAAEAALTSYAGYLAASREASRVADPHHPQLPTFLADPLLTRVRATIRTLKQRGAVRIGSVVSQPTVAEVNLSAVPATVSIQDCIDTTGYRMVYAKNKSPVPGASSGRYVATATASRYPDGRWLINNGAAHPDQPC